MIRVFALAVDGNTIGLGGLSGALVIALGYMLRDRRDSDSRVDKANSFIVETLKAERDRAFADADRLRSALEEVRQQRDDERERNRILQLRLGLREDQA